MAYSSKFASSRGFVHVSLSVKSSLKIDLTSNTQLLYILSCLHYLGRKKIYYRKGQKCSCQCLRVKIQFFLVIGRVPGDLICSMYCKRF